MWSPRTPSTWPAQGTRVRLEGHTDERGSREYNIGLGERRAQAVRRSLLLQGATDAQISTVSYGAEPPAVSGHDEAAWAKNRRVEIAYLALPTGAVKP
jgi:peptidoglycan-associated lipoprotein